MNCIDEHYKELLQTIIDYGVEKKDRTGTGTKSIFGYTIRHRMNEGFPLLTTKKMAWKTMVTELLWFLRGDTNIKYLVDNNCHIWDGDAYQAYIKRYNKGEYVGKTKLLENSKKNRTLTEPFTIEEFIDKIKTDDEFASNWGELGPIYGKQWRRWTNTSKGWIKDSWFEREVDQIANLINNLKTNPDSRRLMVSAWDVGSIDQMVLPPCHYGFQVYTRELSFAERVMYYETTFGRLHFIPPSPDALDARNIPTRAISLMWNQRSVDTFLGLPFNIASYGLLLEIIAKMVNMVPDQLIGNLGDVHLYNNHIEQAKEQIERESFELPKLNINTEFWPYEGGECGVGPIDATAVLNSFKDNNFCKCLLNDDIQLSNYQSHPAIKAPLSN
jgi:thymidylate synthase